MLIRIAQSRSRTDDLRITNALLYQLSYLGMFRKNMDRKIGLQRYFRGLYQDGQ
jgi:hypothetical protein